MAESKDNIKTARGTQLTIDIGNTNIVLGLFVGKKLKNRWRVNTRRDVTIDEIILTLRGLFSPEELKAGNITQIGLATVVPSLQYQWSRALEVKFNVTPVVMDAVKCTTFSINLDFPGQIGADRLCNILACQALGINEAIVVDFGTATTLDVYSENTYWGGIICPGVQTSLNALAARASKLSEVELHWNTRIIGTNTDDALRNGILFGTLGQIEYMLGKILKEKPMNSPQVIATGGLAKLFGTKCRKIDHVINDLTLIGLNYLLARENYAK